MPAPSIRLGPTGSAFAGSAIPETVPDDASLQVFVRDLAGEPVSSVRVEVFGRRLVRAASTDGTGRASFQSLVPGAYDLALEGARHERLASIRPIELVSGQDRRIELVLDPALHSIAGRVRSESGAPLAGVIVYARRYVAAAAVGELVPEEELRQFSTTDEDGHFLIEALSGGEYRIRAAAGEAWRIPTYIVQAGDHDLELIAAATTPLVVRGIVTGREGGAIEAATVELAGRLRSRTLTSATGEYSIELRLIEDGAYGLLRFAHPAFLPRELAIPEPTESGEGVVRLDARLVPRAESSRLSGRVVDPSGRPVAGASVLVRHQARSERLTTRSAVDGKFELTELEPDDGYTVVVRHAGSYRDWTLGPIRVDAPASDLGEIVLAPLGRGALTGRVIDAEGNPIPGFRIELRSRRALAKSLMLESDARGRFELGDVPAGELVFETPYAPLMTASGVHLEPGERRVLELVVDVGDRRLDGRVVDAAGGPVAGAWVWLTWQHQRGELKSASRRRTQSDGQGLFAFHDIGPDSHVLGAQHHDRGAVRLDWSPGDSDEPVELRLDTDRVVAEADDSGS